MISPRKFISSNLRIQETQSFSFPQDNSLAEIYHQKIRKRLCSGVILLFLLILFSYLSIKLGSVEVSWKGLIQALFKKSDLAFIIWNIRLPRTAGAVLAGAILGMAGAVMQNLLKNPLASPFTLGVSHGAGFGAALAIIVFGAGQTHSYGSEAVTILSAFPVAGLAFLGSMTSVSFILLISYFKRATAESIILAGVALSSLFSSATMLLQYFASDVRVAATVFWLFGDLGKAGWKENQMILAGFVLAFIYFFWQRWNFNALNWGDEVARSLGVNLERTRLLGMFFSATVVALVTAFFGIIGFVGLISPHMTRLIIGNDFRFVLPYSALTGACLLLVVDLVARRLLAPVILPTGIVTSFIGVPVFVFLLLKRKRI